MKISLQELKDMTANQRLSAFVCWLSTQPRDEVYDFMDCRDCALCRFSKKVVNHVTSAGGWGIRDGGLHKGDYLHFYEPGDAVADAFCTANRTFGQLYDKLLPLVTTPLLPTVELSEAALEALELRELIPFQHTKA